MHRHLLQQFGTPRYVKIDVKGADREILQTLRALEERPAFISVEEYGVAEIDDLRALSYDSFFIAPQRIKSWVDLPNPAKKGDYFKKAFNGYDSGPFGREIGPWLSYDEARALCIRRLRRGRQLCRAGTRMV